MLYTKQTKEKPDYLTDMNNTLDQHSGMIKSLLKLCHFLMDENMFFHFKMTILPIHYSSHKLNLLELFFT